MSFWLDAGRDLAALLRRPRRAWYEATHARCPVCLISVRVGREWFDHRDSHDEAGQ